MEYSKRKIFQEWIHLNAVVMRETNCLTENQKLLRTLNTTVQITGKTQKLIFKCFALNIIIIWYICICIVGSSDVYENKQLTKWKKMLAILLESAFSSIFFFIVKKNGENFEFERICLLDFIPLLIQIKLNCQSFC